MKPKAIAVCVEYDDILALTLPTWLRHFDDILIVTTPADQKTRELAEALGVRVHYTDAFYRNGAEFNKGAAMEEGFDSLGRDGWLCILDADIVLPPIMPMGDVRPGTLYGARRRSIVNPLDWHGGYEWHGLPTIPDTEIAGYFQLFHAASTQLTARPWYPTTLRSAASCDNAFMLRFGHHQQRLGFDVLHLGPTGNNWCGRTTPRIDTGETPAEAEARAMQRERLVRQRMAGNRDYERLPK